MLRCLTHNVEGVHPTCPRCEPCSLVGRSDVPIQSSEVPSHTWKMCPENMENVGVEPKIGLFAPQIIHLFIGFSMIFTIHFGVPLFLETPMSTFFPENDHIFITYPTSQEKSLVENHHENSKSAGCLVGNLGQFVRRVSFLFHWNQGSSMRT